MDHVIGQLSEQVRAAVAARRALRPVGGATKDFYGERLEGEPLPMEQLSGIVDYDPSELYITVRAGTALADVESELNVKHQYLAFEPPHFGTGSTVGGCVASGLSGPTRMRVGSLRDFILGIKLIDGRGDLLSFGGQVMKNVAGYDVSRLIAGSLGTLALIVEVTIKVLPRPASTATLEFEFDEATGVRRINEWVGRALPIASSAWRDGRLHIRLSGAKAAVDASCAKLGGERLPDKAASAFWDGMRNQVDSFFSKTDVLWRLAVPATTAPLPLPGDQLIEWNGAQRWWHSDSPAQTVRGIARDAGGHATLFRSSERKGVPVFTPLDPVQMRLHRNVKNAFDPHGVFGPGRLYPEL